MASNLPNDFLPAVGDPNIEKLAEQLQDDLPNSRDRKYASTMQQIAENLDFQTMTRRLSYALMQADEIENGGPAVMMRYWNDEKVLKMFGLVMGIRPYFADAVASFENYGPDETGDMGNEDSKNSGSDVTEDMESEDESSDHSYYGYVTEEDMENEDESTVHSKNSGSDVTEDMENEDESTVHSKNSGSDVTEDMENEDESTVHSKNSGSNVTKDMENEDESTVHHIAVVDDVELCCWKLDVRCQQPSVFPIVIKSKMQIESIHEEHSLLEFMLKLNLVDLLFRRVPKKFLMAGIDYRNKRALLIAQEYEEDGIEDSLPHSIAQMFRLRKILITKYGFNKKDVVVMTDRKGEKHNTCYPPTSSNIKKVFKKLAYGLKPDDLFLLYFIGHGGRYKAPQDSPNDTGFVAFISTAKSTRICEDM
ncbi:hypothetical protein OROMI_030563 [Orobanche minor]